MGTREPQGEAVVRRRDAARPRNRIIGAVAAVAAVTVAVAIGVSTTLGRETSGTPAGPSTQSPSGSPAAVDALVPWSDRTDFERWEPATDGTDPWEERGWRDLVTTLSLPESVAAGDTLTYIVTLTNDGSKNADLRPCGGYVQAITPASGDLTWPGTAWEHRLNCDSLPELAAGASRSYRMRLPIPEDAPTLPRAQLMWALHDGGDSALGYVAITKGAEPTEGPAPHTGSTAPSTEQPTATDEALIRNFVEFANDPSMPTLARLSLSDSTDLGLGSTIYSTVRKAEAAARDSWTLHLATHNAYTGPFNPLDPIRRRGADVTDYDISIGPHSHCASPPRPAPAGFNHHRRVSIQPAEGTFSSCLEWFTVDLFVSDDGIVDAVTLDLYEP